MSLNEDAAEKPSKIYNILITNDSISVGPDYWLDLIKADKDHIVKKRAISPEAISRNDVWRESHMLKSYTERRMIRHSKKQDMHCALNQPGMTFDQSPPSEEISVEKWLLIISR